MLRFVVSHPIDKVEDLAPEDLGAENFADLELRKAVHLDGRGDLLESIGKRLFATWGSRRLTWNTG